MNDNRRTLARQMNRSALLYLSMMLLLLFSFHLDAEAADTKATRHMFDDRMASGHKESEAGRMEAAISDYSAIIRLLSQTDRQMQVDYRMAWFERALCLEKLKKYQAAAADMKKLFGLQPMSRWPCYAACRIFAEAGQYEDAITYVDKYTVSTKTRAGAYAIRSACSAMLHHPTQTVRDLMQALSLNFGRHDRQFDGKQPFCSNACLATLASKAGSSLQTHPAETHFELGIFDLLAERYQDADKHLTKCLKVQPGNWQALNAQANCYLGLNELKKALKNINRALQLEPNNPANYALLETYYSRTGNFDAIIDDLAARLKKTPKNVSICIAQANAFSRMKDSAKELDAFLRALTIDPKSITALMGKARVYQETFQYDKAITAFSEAIRLAPKNSDPYSDRATCYFAVQDYQKAVADLTRALEIAPDPYTYAARAECYMKLGKPDLAAKDKAEADQNGNGS